MLLTTTIQAQNRTDTLAIESILQGETLAWNKGDAMAYSRHFAEKGTFTNILGMFSQGHKSFEERHTQIFKGVFKGTHMQQKMVSLQFIAPQVAIVETLICVAGFSNTAPLPGTYIDLKGRLRTRLLQVLVKEGRDWKVMAYHNVDVKSVVAIEDP